jgi:metal-sulfur cluster biosynthetic enzyme
MSISPPLHSGIWDALATVRDPELDEPITELGFVNEAEVHEGHVSVRLRLPTYFCAPNFAYLMVADACDAVRAVPGVVTADVRLEDHFASEEINAGVAAGNAQARRFYERFGFVPSGRVQLLPAPFPPIEDIHYRLSP